MTITDKADFKAKVRASMRQLQNAPEKIRTKNYRSNMPPDSAFTYGLINNLKPLANWPTPQDLRPHERDILVTADGSGLDSPVPNDFHETAQLRLCASSRQNAVVSSATYYSKILDSGPKGGRLCPRTVEMDRRHKQRCEDRSVQAAPAHFLR
jgi:hypothetical protein